MKTTIYELLGMIKDGKAPKRIVYKNNCYEWFDDEKDYITETHWLFDEYVITDILNDEVEILETTITYKQDTIKKVDEPYESVIFKTDYEFATELEKKIIDNIELIRKKQDEIINKLNNTKNITNLINNMEEQGIDKIGIEDLKVIEKE